MRDLNTWKKSMHMFHNYVRILILLDISFNLNKYSIFFIVFVSIDLICLHEKSYDEHAGGSTIPPEERQALFVPLEYISVLLDTQAVYIIQMLRVMSLHAQQN